MRAEVTKLAHGCSIKLKLEEKLPVLLLLIAKLRKQSAD